jgi:SAM-dependent methyltransferase
LEAIGLIGRKFGVCVNGLRFVRDFARRISGTEIILERLRLHEHMLLELYEAAGRPLPASRMRWHASRPQEAGITGRQVINGRAFVEEMKRSVEFTPRTRLLEIGPGNGRLLRSLLDEGVPFANYTGLEISPANVEFLKTTFKDTRTKFLAGDINDANMSDLKFDAAFASLTFKHLYPSFANAVRNIGRSMDAGGLLAFDLPHSGSVRRFEGDGVTYFRAYEPDEVGAILDACSFVVQSIETVRHNRNLGGLFVVARKK